MSILAVEIKIPRAVNVEVTEDTLTVELNDGRTISVPLQWYPRLVYATPEERIGDSLEMEKEFIGKTWTRILASQDY